MTDGTEKQKQSKTLQKVVILTLFNKPGTFFLTDKADISERGKKHFQDLLNRPSLTDPNALNNIDQLPSNTDTNIPPSL